jgi:hypothetical protein
LDSSDTRSSLMAGLFYCKHANLQEATMDFVELEWRHA